MMIFPFACDHPYCCFAITISNFKPSLLPHTQSRLTKRRTGRCSVSSSSNPPARSSKSSTNATPRTPSAAFSTRSCCRAMCRTKERPIGKETVPMARTMTRKKRRTADAARAAPPVITGWLLFYFRYSSISISDHVIPLSYSSPLCSMC